MPSKRTIFLTIIGTVLLLSLLAMAGFGQADEFQKAASTGAVTYHVVAVPNTMTAAQLQTILTAQGSMGFHFVAPFAVGTGPIPTGQAYVFSKP
jgi:hypothetical protein